ncbi:MAG: MotA/TolQ/ExbB proton channel family protein [Gammaproteobacteria bacterium]|nr:MotA/TolQ/ExbB proton channel family protein [Gammaproteobacteria bacterium]
MPLSFMFIFCAALAALVASVALGALFILDWPLWADLLLYLVLLASVTLTFAGLRALFGKWRERALSCMQALATLGLVAAAASLAAPAWQALGGGDGGASVAGRLVPMFITALLLYAANLWLDATLSAQHEGGNLERLTRLLAGPRLLPALITALLLTAGMILAMDWLGRGLPGARVITLRFLDRGIIPPLTVLLFFWGLLLLLGKQWNARDLRRAVRDWRHKGAAKTAAKKSAKTSMKIAGKIGAKINMNMKFGEEFGATALRASIAALAKDKTPPDEAIALLWQRYEESYLLPRYISWAVPVLGFIGTVLGISLAADGIRRIIGSDTGLSGLSGDLSGAIAPLGIAFDTTLIALSLSVALTLFLSLVQRSEERALAMLEWEVRSARRAG